MVPCTPSLPPGYTNYTFDVGIAPQGGGCGGCAAPAAELKILMGGTDVTGATTNVVVGQPINLTCTLTGGTINTVGWNLPPTNYYFGDYVANNQEGRVDPVTNTSSTSLNFYFKDTPGPGSLLTVSCVVNATVSGAATTISRNVKFNVLRPTAYFWATNSGRANIGTLANGDIVLRLGAVPATPDIPYGMMFIAQTLNVPSGYGFGTWEYVQLVTSHTLKYNNPSNTEGITVTGSGLDREVPFPMVVPQYSTNAGIVRTNYSGDDSPRVSIVGRPKLWRDDDYEMYLFWTADIPGSKRVPIRRINWSLSIAATNSTSMGLAAPLRPNLPPAGRIQGLDWSRFPTWNKTILNNLSTNVGPPF